MHNRGIYCPLNPPTNPPDTVKEKIVSRWQAYNRTNFSMWTNEKSRMIAEHVLKTGDDKAAKKYGIKGPFCLADLTSIDIPRSFPPDVMHLWWENIIPEHWRGKFFSTTDTTDRSGMADISEADYDADSEQLEDGRSFKKRSKKRKKVKPTGTAQPTKRFVKTNDPYNIAPEELSAIGKDTAESAATIPASFGNPIRDFAEHCHHLKAAERKIFTLDKSFPI